MAFDRTDPTDLLALKTEVNTDPAGVGYDPTNTQDVLDKLNIATNNPGSETGVPKLSLGRFWEIVADDSATATQFEFNVGNLFAMAAGEGPDTDISRYRPAIIGLGDTQINNDLNAESRALSRGEVLFGATLADGTYEEIAITQQDWFAARDS